MSKMAEILASGKPPGFGGISVDPLSADAAVPRALKQMEGRESADSIVRGMGWKPTKRNVAEIKKTWKL